MKDRLKFRAWNITEKEYCTEITHAYDGNNLGTKGNDAHICCFGEYIDDENYIVEQCTGLKDRKGIFIYEGDIIKTDDSVDKIVFYEPCACFGIDNKETGYYDFSSIDFVASVDWEVIGNINQNGDLLNEQN